MRNAVRVVFYIFWYIGGWVPDPIRSICKIECMLENLAKKADNLQKFWFILRQIDKLIDHKITLFKVIQMVDFAKSTLSIPVHKFSKTPLGPLNRAGPQ